MKRVIVISTSLRRGSNSDMLADKFAEGARRHRIFHLRQRSKLGWKDSSSR